MRQVSTQWPVVGYDQSDVCRGKIDLWRHRYKLGMNTAFHRAFIPYIEMPYLRRAIVRWRIDVCSSDKDISGFKILGHRPQFVHAR